MPTALEKVSLDSMPREQLVSLCRYFGLYTWGSDFMLKYQLGNRFRKLHEDDLLLDEEGVESLTLEELSSACILRGIPMSLKRKDMVEPLGNWVRLHVREKVPTLLLVLARMFVMEPSAISESHLAPESPVDMSNLTPAAKIEIIQQEQRAIKDESILKGPSPLNADLAPLFETISVVLTRSVGGAVMQLAGSHNVSRSLEKSEDQLRSLVEEINTDVEKIAAGITVKVNDRDEVSLKDIYEVVGKIVSDAQARSRVCDLIKVLDKQNRGRVFLSDLFGMINSQIRV